VIVFIICGSAVLSSSLAGGYYNYQWNLGYNRARCAIGKMSFEMVHGSGTADKWVGMK
jgi:hypothetical protein